MIHFGLRGCKEQRELRWGKVVINKDIDGKEYVEYFEMPNKQSLQCHNILENQGSQSKYIALIGR